MATLGILLSFAMVALLYGRDVFEDSAAVFFVAMSAAIFAVSDVQSWLILILPIVPSWIEALFRIPEIRPRRGSWLLFLMLPAVALALWSYAQPAQWGLVARLLPIQAALALNAELKQHCLPLLYRKARLVAVQFLGRLLAPLMAAFVVGLAQLAWLPELPTQGSYIFALCLGASLLHELALWLQQREEFAFIFRHELIRWLLPTMVIWSVVWLVPPVI